MADTGAEGKQFCAWCGSSAGKTLFGLRRGYICKECVEDYPFQFSNISRGHKDAEHAICCGCDRSCERINKLFISPLDDKALICNECLDLMDEMLEEDRAPHPTAQNTVGTEKDANQGKNIIDDISDRDELFDSLVGLSIARQMAFADTASDHHSTWRFHQQEGKYLVTMPSLGTFEAQILGTESFESNTWLMSWANDSFAEATVKAAKEFSQYFQDKNDEVLSEPQLPLWQINGDLAAVIATQLLGASVYLAMPNGDAGMVFMLLFGVPLVNFARTPLPRIMQVMNFMVTCKQIKDKELAVRQYLLAEGFLPADGSGGKSRSLDFNSFSKKMNDPYKIKSNTYSDKSGREIVWAVSDHDSYIFGEKADRPEEPKHDFETQLSWCLRSLERPCSDVPPDEPGEQLCGWCGALPGQVVKLFDLYDYNYICDGCVENCAETCSSYTFPKHRHLRCCCCEQGPTKKIKLFASPRNPELFICQQCLGNQMTKVRTLKRICSWCDSPTSDTEYLHTQQRSFPMEICPRCVRYVIGQFNTTPDGIEDNRPETLDQAEVRDAVFAFLKHSQEINPKPRDWDNEKLCSWCLGFDSRQTITIQRKQPPKNIVDVCNRCGDDFRKLESDPAFNKEEISELLEAAKSLNLTFRELILTALDYAPTLKA